MQQIFPPIADVLALVFFLLPRSCKCKHVSASACFCYPSVEKLRTTVAPSQTRLPRPWSDGPLCDLSGILGRLCSCVRHFRDVEADNATWKQLFRHNPSICWRSVALETGGNHTMAYTSKQPCIFRANWVSPRSALVYFLFLGIRDWAPAIDNLRNDTYYIAGFAVAGFSAYSKCSFPRRVVVDSGFQQTSWYHW